MASVIDMQATMKIEDIPTITAHAAKRYKVVAIIKSMVALIMTPPEYCP